jgi:hypothetical protein
MTRALAGCVALLGLALGASAQRVVEAPEPNATPASATSLPLGAEAAGVLTNAADADWYAVTVAAGARLRIETGPGAAAVQARDTVVTLLDAVGAPVCSNDDGVASGWYTRLVTAALPAGQYFVAVEGGAAAVAGGAYALDVRAVTVPAFAGATAVEGPENNDPRSGGTATAVTLPARCSGAVGSAGIGGDWDFYRFTLAVDATVEARVDATASHPSATRLDDPVLYLFDVATPPNLLAGPFQSRSFGVYDAWLEARLSAGTYQIAVRGWSGSTTGAYYLDLVRRDAARTTVGVGGCGGRNLSVPATDAGPGAPLRLERPVLGATWSLLGSNLGAGGFAFHVVGLQATAVDLTAFGAPGCVLEVVYLDTPLQVADGAGRAVFVLRLPDTPSLLGTTIESQVAVFDLANALGVTLSNRVSAAVGY